MSERIYAEDVNYWKTSTISPDTWIDKATKLIEEKGGVITATGFGHDAAAGRAAFMIAFDADGESFKVVWPVLESKKNEPMAARRQAATMLYHDVKAKMIAAQVLGFRVSFFQWVKLPSGAVAYQLSGPDLEDQLPRMLTHG